jgi:hypothetical protein
MADGKGCKCAAYDESECACDADWTPQELVDARAEIARLRLTDAEREAVAASREFWLSEAACELRDETDQRYADALGGLLERMK